MPISRRDMLRTAAYAGTLAALPHRWMSDAHAAETALNVFAPLPPDPSPPGAAKFSEEALAKWKAANAASVNYELVAWPQLHDRMATAFASGSAPWDVVYMC